MQTYKHLVAADCVRRPVKLALSREEDMMMTGARHAFVGVYKAAARRSDLSVVACDVTLYCNGGYSLDLSAAVTDRGIFHCTNAYLVENVAVRGVVVRTNKPSNTAFRGFGGPQGMLVCEGWICALADRLGVPAEHVRRANLFPSQARTHYGQLVPRSPLPRLFQELVGSDGEQPPSSSSSAPSSASSSSSPSSFALAERRAACEAFNAKHRWRKRGVAAVPTMFGISFTAKFMNQGGGESGARSKECVVQSCFVLNHAVLTQLPSYPPKLSCTSTRPTAASSSPPVAQRWGRVCTQSCAR